MKNKNTLIASLIILIVIIFLIILSNQKNKEEDNLKMIEENGQSYEVELNQSINLNDSGLLKEKINNIDTSDDYEEDFREIDAELNTL